MSERQFVDAHEMRLMLLAQALGYLSAARLAVREAGDHLVIGVERGSEQDIWSHGSKKQCRAIAQMLLGVEHDCRLEFERECGLKPRR